MEVAAALRILWGRRLRLALGAVVAVVLGVMLGRSPVPASGLAQTRVVLETPRSQLVSADPKGSETLYWRATLLGMQLGTGAARHRMAAQLHIAPNDLGFTDIELTAPSTVASLPTAAVTAAAPTQPFVLAVRTDDVLPMINIAATAPDRAGAAKLAQAAVSSLQSNDSSTTTKQWQGLSIEQVSPIVAREVPGGSGRTKMAVMVMVVFSLWCVGLLIGPGIAGLRRKTDEAALLGL